MRSVPFKGPRFDGVERRGDALHVRFRDVAKGLCAHDLGTNYIVRSRQGQTGLVRRNSPSAEVEGFAVTGADGVWHWADEATIDGSGVLVRSRAIREPVAVRYGWSANPYVNLYNSDGLPAVPFGVRYAAPPVAPGAHPQTLRPY
jgi:sialate O-acetylesterase